MIDVQVRVLLPIYGKNKIANRRFVKENGFVVSSDNNFLDNYAGIYVYKFTSNNNKFRGSGHIDTDYLFTMDMTINYII